MAYKFFSQRQNDGQGTPEVLEYDNLPMEFRNQFLYILVDVCSECGGDLWRDIHRLYCREKGLLRLGSHYVDSWKAAELNIMDYVSSASTSDLLDFIDFTYNIFCDLVKQQKVLQCYLENDAPIEDAIEELNDRFKQHNLGYEAINGELIRVDNRVIHEQYVKPALSLLCNEEFEGAEEEYRNAYEARRVGNNKDAILNATKCFESVMKTICEKKGYSFNPQRDTANNLLNILKKENFFPAYMNNHLDNVINTLISGAPTVRNKEAGHGQGSEITEVPDCLVDYVLGLVAVNCVLLVNLYKESQ